MVKITQYRMIEKIAKRREIVELVKGTLSKKSIKRLIKNNAGMKHERFIKRIGEGSTNVVDLVLHPKHGLSIRKTFNFPTDLSNIKETPDFKILNRLRAIQRKRKKSFGFSRIYENNPRTGISFEEYIPGKNLVSNTELTNIQKNAINILKKKFPNAFDYDQARNTIRTLRNKNIIIDISGGNVLAGARKDLRYGKYDQFLLRKNLKFTQGIL